MLQYMNMVVMTWKQPQRPSKKLHYHALRTYVNCEMSHTVNIIDLVCTLTTAVAGAIVE